MRFYFFIIFLLINGLCYSQNDFYLAENYFRESEYEKAIQIYKKLAQKNKYSPVYLKRLVTCYQEIEKFDLAEKALHEELRNNPSLYYLHVEIGYNLERQQKKEAAKKHYSLALSGIEKNPVFGELTGRLYQENNLLDLAIEAYKKTMTFNTASNFNFQIAQIYGEKGDFEKMFNCYFDLIDSKKSYISLAKQYISKYISENPLDKNNVLFKRTLLKRSVSNPKNTWNELLSWLFTKQKEYRKALIQEKALFKRNPDYLSNINTLGTTAFENKDYDAAKECFQYILSNTQNIDEKLFAHLYDLKSAVALNNKNAEFLFDKVLNTYGRTSLTLPIQVAYADYLTFKKNEPVRAQKILEKALTLSSSKFEKASMQLKLGDVLVFMGKYNKALICFSQIQTRLKNHPLAQDARFKVAQTSYFKGDFTWAMAQLKVLKGSTSQLIANDAVHLFLTISDNEPKDSIPAGLKSYANADLLAFQNKNTEALAMLSDIIKKYKGQPIEDDALFKQAAIYTKERQFENAIANYLKIIELDKQGVLVDDALYELAEVYHYNLNDPKKASEYYQKIIFDFGSSIYLVDARKKYRMLRGDIVN
ncbi:MAG: tetratricopeptide repeat protein [Flavobacteriaceae bacterium]|nr:MAG: tetratricopeptide repeat protein [Flavobacteriaceae bacterium]